MYLYSLCKLQICWGPGKQIGPSGVIRSNLHCWQATPKSTQPEPEKPRKFQPEPLTLQKSLFHTAMYYFILYFLQHLRYASSAGGPVTAWECCGLRDIAVPSRLMSEFRARFWFRSLENRHLGLRIKGLGIRELGI